MRTLAILGESEAAIEEARGYGLEDEKHSRNERGAGP